MVKNPSRVKNKVKRTSLYTKYKSEKKAAKKSLKKERIQEAEALGQELPKKTPRTIENTRLEDENRILPNDTEVLGDEQDDEFAEYYSGAKVSFAFTMVDDSLTMSLKKPKIMITTRPKCSRKLFTLIADLMQMVPNAFYYPRETKTVQDMIADAESKKFTHLIVLSERLKECDGLLIAHLPKGPTAFLRLSSFEPGSKIPGHGRPTSHIPELILNNFNTRLGRRIGRLLGSLFPHEPQFEGRQVVTFHNQRDFIFVRHHRYIYREENSKTRARLQELGPRFTLKPRWLQEGLFDTQFGEYEWIYKRRTMDVNRRKFNL